ncbi:MAG: hypothetical protein JRD89_02510 [Deltaproteobacteria bacterium]|nr:hypothetical protein [Deltaproteobacteria bacterium]
MYDDFELETLLAPPHQLTEAPLVDPSPISRDLELTGELTGPDRARMAAEHGRYLSGVDNMSTQSDPRENLVEKAEHAEVFDMEAQDDVLGSGIFDPYHRGGTANRNAGVFASKNSLPGYLAREVPFTASTEVTDLTDGAAVVTVPAGGMAYVERDGHLADMNYPGPIPQPPVLAPVALTTRDEPYAMTGPASPQGWDVDTLLQAADAAPYGVPPTRNTGTPGPAPVPQRRAVSGLGQAAWPPGHPPRQPMFHVKQLPQSPASRLVAMVPHQTRLAAQSIVSPVVARMAFGQDPAEQSPTKTLVAYGVAGVVVGAALRMLLGARRAR